MNLNEIGVTGNNRNKRRAPKIIYLQRGQPTPKERKRKAPSTNSASATTKSNEKWNNESGHCSVNATSNATSTTLEESGIVVAITEGRGEAACEVGISAMNMQHPELSLFQISDTSSYVKVLTKIHLLGPSEILVPITMSTNRLVDALKNTFPLITIVAVDRSSFRKESGLQFVKHSCATSFNSVLLIIQQKYYALAAAGALRSYLEMYKRFTCAKESIKVNYNESDYNTMIDVFAADKLELVACALDGSHSTPNKKYSSLRGVLNHCVTKLGLRMLRSTILQPPNQQEEIESRLNCVEELVKCPEKLLGVRDVLIKLANFGQVLSLASLLRTNEQYCDVRHLNYILQLNNFFDEIEPLKELLVTANSTFFHEIHETLSCEEFKALDAHFKFIIHEDARPASGEQAKVARCFAIKAGHNEILDILRNKYSDRLTEMKNHVNEVAKEVGLDLKLANNVKKGYHIALVFGSKQRQNFKKSSLPPGFCQIDIMSTMVTMKTIKLLTLSNQLDDTEVEILRVSNSIIHQLLLKVQTCISSFYHMCEQIAKLDVLQSLAQASTASAGKYVRPKFSHYTKVVGGRHPLLDYLLNSEPVANDIIATPDKKLHLITGPNGSGKSIYIRQIVLLQVMAQIGCFIPAVSATFKICDHILARIYFEDKMEVGASAFTLEMKEIKYFFNIITNRTLIIIDELCRSTAVREGTALAMAICEHLLKTPAFVYFTTHYTYITELQQMYPNIQCWQLETKEIHQPGLKPKLQFTHKVIPGVVTLEDYALTLARALWPNVIIKDVEAILPQIKNKSKDMAIDKKLALKINFENELKELKRQGKCLKYDVYVKYMNYRDALAKLGVHISYDSNDKENDSENAPSSNIPQECARSDETEEINDLGKNVVDNDSDIEGVNEPIVAEAVYSESDLEGNAINNSLKTMNTTVISDATKCNFYQNGVKSYKTIRFINATIVDSKHDIANDTERNTSSIINKTVNTSKPSGSEVVKYPSSVTRTPSASSEQAQNYFAEAMTSSALPAFMTDNQIPENINTSNKFTNTPSVNTPVTSKSTKRKSSDSENNNFFRFQNPAGYFSTNKENTNPNMNKTMFSGNKRMRSSASHLTVENIFSKSFPFLHDAGENYQSANSNDLNYSFNLNNFLGKTPSVNPFMVENIQASKTSQIIPNVTQRDANNKDQMQNAPNFVIPGGDNIRCTSNISSTSISSAVFAFGLNREKTSTPCPPPGTVSRIKAVNDLVKRSVLSVKKSEKPNTKLWNLNQTILNDLDLALDEIGEKNVTSNFQKEGKQSSSSAFDTKLTKNVITPLTSTNTNTKTKSNQTATTSTSNATPSEKDPRSAPAIKKRRLLSLQEMQEDLQNKSSSSSSNLQYKTVPPDENIGNLQELMEKSHISTENYLPTTAADPSLINYKLPATKKFQPPVKKPANKLTKKEILEFYNKKRIAAMESSNPAAAEAYCKEILNRPSVKQIQASEVLVTARKVSTGEFVLDMPKTKMGAKNHKRFEPPLKPNLKFGRNIAFDKTMFSDVNSRAFDKFIESSKSSSSNQGPNNMNFEHFKQDFQDKPRVTFGFEGGNSSTS